MPENTTNSTRDNDEDDVRKRFAHIEEADASTSSDELPPVPAPVYERPKEAAKADTATARRIGLVANAGDVKGSGQALTIGTGLVGSIVAGVVLGMLADKYLLHSSGTPWGLIVGFLLGVTSGFINLVRVANRLNKD